MLLSNLLLAFHPSIQWWVFALVAPLTSTVAGLTIRFQNIKATLANPVQSLKSE